MYDSSVSLRACIRPMFAWVVLSKSFFRSVHFRICNKFFCKHNCSNIMLTIKLSWMILKILPNIERLKFTYLAKEGAPAMISCGEWLGWQHFSFPSWHWSSSTFLRRLLFCSICWMVLWQACFKCSISTLCFSTTLSRDSTNPSNSFSLETVPVFSPLFTESLIKHNAFGSATSSFLPAKACGGVASGMK